MATPPDVPGHEPTLRIDPAEVSQARLPGPPPPRPRVSHLAVASLALGVLAFPLVGLLLGPIAIGCGVLALGATQERVGLRGGRLAMAGIALGTLAIVAWTVGLAVALSRREPDRRGPVPPLVEASARAELGIDDAPAPIRGALLANVFLRCTGSDGEGTGSGVIVARDAGGYCALTNRHVVECGARRRELTAATPGTPGTAARVCWSPPGEVDLAVVRVALEPGGARRAVEPVKVRTADVPRVGDPVFAVGNPLGYEASYTAGVISAVRTTAPDEGGLRVLQVQASVNPGNSGGGLYDREGRLVGLNTWRRFEAEGMAFAISAADAVRLLEGASTACGCELPHPKGGETP